MFCIDSWRLASSSDKSNTKITSDRKWYELYLQFTFCYFLCGLLLLCLVSVHLWVNHTSIIKLDLSLNWKTFGSTPHTLSGVLVRKYQRELNRNDCNVHLNCGAKCRRLVLSIWVFQFALHLSWEEIGNPTHPLVKLKMINFNFLFLPQFRNQLLLPHWETFRKVETLCWLLADLNTAVSAGIYSLILRCFVFLPAYYT